MDCKGTPQQQCIASNDCTWVNAQRRQPYCRRKTRGGGAAVVPAQMRQQDLATYTMVQLRTHPLYRGIQGRSRMRKNELVQALRQAMQRQRTQQVQEQASWQQRCKRMEERCPMSTTLTGDAWCDIPEDTVIRSTNYDMCFEYSELLRVMHEGFIAVDTSYEIPPLRMKLPRDPYRRLIPKPIAQKLLTNERMFEENKVYLSNNQDLLYFLCYIDDFYRTFDKPQYTAANADPVQTSRDLERWFKKHRRLGGGLKLTQREGVDARGAVEYTFEWEFRRQPREYTLTNGGLQLYT